MILQLPEVKETAERMIKDLKAKKSGSGGAGSLCGIVL